MNAIRIKRHLNSETLLLPELKPLIGEDVIITIRKAAKAKVSKSVNVSKKPEKTWFDQHFGAGRDCDFEGFDEAREQWRNESMASHREPPE